MSKTTPMIFENLRDSIESLLISEQTGFYLTIVGQKQSFAAEEFRGDSRTVQLYYSAGDYNRSRSSRQQFEHDCTYSLQYNVSSPAKADLSVLDDSNASTAAKQAALANAQRGYVLADKLMDELRRVITQVIMSPQNDQLGLPRNGTKETRYQVSNRWLSNFRKTQPIDKGNLVVIMGSEDLTARVTETVTGVIPVLAVAPTFDITNDQRPPNGDVPTVIPPKTGIQTEQ